LRSDAARIGGVGLQTIRDWGAAGPEGLKDGKAPGQPSLLKDEHRRALAQKVEDGPNPAADGMVRWRLIDLARWIFEEYRISVTKQILSRELHAMGYRKLLARPRQRTSCSSDALQERDAARRRVARASGARTQERHESQRCLREVEARWPDS
jgi:transposase